MGDASGVLPAADPVLTAQLKLGLLVVGAATGYAVDALGIAPRRRWERRPAPSRAPASVPALPRASSRLHELGVLPVLLWLLLGTSATVSVPVTFQLLDPADLYLLLGVAGTLLAVVIFLRGGCRLADHDPSAARASSVGEVLRHGGDEVAFVTVWVSAA